VTTAATVEIEEIAGASTKPFDVAITRDGEAWDLTGATVSVIFRGPDGTEVTKAATITDAAAGEATYVTATTDLVPTKRRERWTRSWKVVQGGTNRRSLPIPFVLVAAP
jgi:hypothetical protein